MDNKINDSLYNQQFTLFNKNKIIDNALAKYFFNDIPEYWKEDNLNFLKTNPNLTQQFIRNVNPLTNTGSALVQIAQGVDDKSYLDTVSGMAQLIPVITAPIKYGVSLSKNAANIAKQKLIREIKYIGKNQTLNGTKDTILDNVSN